MENLARVLLCLLSMYASLKCANGQTVDTSAQAPTSDSFGRYGLELSFKNNEFTPALMMGYSHHGIFNHEIFANFTIVKDPYNADRLGFSFSGLTYFGALVLLSLMHTDDVGRSGRNTMMLIVLVPMAVFNSQHHVKVLDLEQIAGMDRTWISALVSTRTDWFAAAEEPWVRWSPGAGLQLEWNDKDPLSGKALGLEIGIDKPFDFVGNTTLVGDARLFAGFKYYFHRISTQ